MTLPASHNISYYKGDTYEFNVYPRTNSDSDGDGVNDVFPLSDYAVSFTIAPKRGVLESTDQEAISGYAVFAPDRTHIKCAITPIAGAQLTSSQTYVYDVKIAKQEADYDKVFTLLSGNLIIQDRVEPIQEDSIELPSQPINITATTTETSISLSWSAPITGGAPDGYYVYATPYSPSYENTVALQQLVDALSLATPQDVTGTNAQITSTTAIPALGIESEPIIVATPYIYAVVSYNTTGSSSPAGNFDVEAGTIDEVYADGGS